MTCACLYSFSPFEGVSVTAIAFGPKIRVESEGHENGVLLAAGSEGGDINYWVMGSENASMLSSTPSVYCHGGSVKRLAWTPHSILSSFPINHEKIDTHKCNKDNEIENPDVFSIWRIASCGDDNTVRVYKIRP